MLQRAGLFDDPMPMVIGQTCVAAIGYLGDVVEQVLVSGNGQAGLSPRARSHSLQMHLYFVIALRTCDKDKDRVGEDTLKKYLR